MSKKMWQRLAMWIIICGILLGIGHRVPLPRMDVAKDTRMPEYIGNVYAQTEEKLATGEREAEKESKKKKEGKTFLWFIKSGGIFMWPICIGSVIAMAFIIEHFVTLKMAKYIPPILVQQVKENIAQANIEGAKALCEQKIALGSSLQQVIKAALQKFGHGRAEMEKVAGEVGYRQAVALNTKVSYLSWIAVLEPMWGLLGTVQGLIQAFMVIAEMSGMANPRALAEGVYAALITTAAGLLIAIPSMTFYYWFKSVVTKIVVGIEQTSSEIIELLAQKETEVIHH
jgi:biopolymer transport protein ExbB